MNLAAWIVIGLLAAGLTAFARRWAEPEVVAMSMLSVLILTGIVPVDIALSGFSHPALITVVAMFVLGASLVRTGVAEAIGALMGRIAGKSEAGLIAVIMLTVGIMSSFMNNIAACVILLPVVHALARESGVAPTRLLIPLSFGSLLGGTLTLIGTPPNLIVAGFLPEHGYAPLRMFDFLPTGAVVLATGILYMVLIGRHLLPKRTPRGDLLDKYRVREYLTEVTVRADSWLVGKPLARTDLARQMGLRVLGVVRDGRTALSPHPAYILKAGDVLVVESSVDDMMKVRQMAGVDIHPEAKLGVADLQSDDVQMVEAVVAPGSRLRGRTPVDVAFRHSYGLTILAIRRQGRTLRTRLHRTALEMGDTLLLQGRKERFEAIREDPNPDLLLLDPLPFIDLRHGKAWVSLAIMIATVTAAAMDLLPMAAATTVGALIMILSGSIKLTEAYEAIDWRIVFLIGGLMPLGAALESTGASAVFAQFMANHLGTVGPVAALGGILLATLTLTQVLSNAATAALIAPLALSLAEAMGANPHAFVIAVAIGASTAFITPMGHQSNVLVYRAGDYSFSDFVRVGSPLVLILVAIVLTVVPRLWPF